MSTKITVDFLVIGSGAAGVCAAAVSWTAPWMALVFGVTAHSQSAEL